MTICRCRLGMNYERDSEFTETSFKLLFERVLGENGCYGAGRMLKKLGDSQRAIEYYSISSWDESLKSADELEAQLNLQK
jgi:hypothetical protein